MSHVETNNTGAVAAEHLPMWWRCMLIAAATLILCSCSAPVRTQLAADKAIAEATQKSDAAAAADGAIVAETPVELTGDPSLQCEQGACDDGGRITLDPYGPLPGPADEYICDGGDYVTPVGVKGDGTIEGLEPEDAMAHYTTPDGRILTTTSCRVCIYTPRFAAVRRVVDVVAHEQPVYVNAMMDQTSPAKAVEALPPITAKQRHAVAVDLGQRPPSLFRQRQQAGGLENLQAAMEAFTSIGAYANLEIVRTGEVSQAEKALVERAMEAAKTLTGNQAPQVAFGVKMAQAEVGIKQPGLIYQTNGPQSPKLRLCKLASCDNAQPGEEIEFTLRFDNVGDQVLDRVTIADNLAARFEYIPGSAKSSVDADLITQSNDAGSSVLRWEIKHPLQPGEGGILRFKVLVR
jgi:uncharacterized repeat protein (TIGR01451 family)